MRGCPASMPPTTPAHLLTHAEEQIHVAVPVRSWRNAPPSVFPTSARVSLRESPERNNPTAVRGQHHPPTDVTTTDVLAGGGGKNPAQGYSAGEGPNHDGSAERSKPRDENAMPRHHPAVG